MQGPDRQPEELGELKKIVSEFIRRLRNIENEVNLLKESKKDLVDEYKEKLDTSTLNAALRTIKIREKVKHKDTYDAFMDILESDDDSTAG